MRQLHKGSASFGVILLLAFTFALAYTMVGGINGPSITNPKPTASLTTTSATSQAVLQVQTTLPTLVGTATATQTHFQALQNQIQQAQATTPSVQVFLTQMQASQQLLTQDITALQTQFQVLQTEIQQSGLTQFQQDTQTLAQNIAALQSQYQAVQAVLAQAQTSPIDTVVTDVQTPIETMSQSVGNVQVTLQDLQAKVQTASAAVAIATNGTADTASNQIIVTQGARDNKGNLHLETFTVVTVTPAAPTTPIVAGLVNCNTNSNIQSIEHGVFKTFAPSIAYPGDAIKVWFADEKTPQLGIGQINVDTPAGKVTKNYPISTVGGSVPSSAVPPQVGAGYTDPDPKWRGTDVYGIPIHPSMFITDITTDPNNRSGDWENGGTTAVPPHALYGAWTSSVKNVDAAGKVTINVGPAAPSKNGWNLGPGSDPVPPYSPTGDTDYGAEAKWDVNTLVSQGYMAKGHTYRVEFIVHDGDATKEGGDVDERCGTVRIP